MLDIGCNSGVLTLKLLDPEFRARSVLGVDIDPELIRKARRRCRGKPTKTASFVVADAASPTFAAGDIGASSAKDGKEAPSVTVPSMKFGLVLCLSVTKWIHLHHGDEGIMRLFRNVTSVLGEGGIFVLGAWRIPRTHTDAMAFLLTPVILIIVPTGLAMNRTADVNSHGSQFVRHWRRIRYPHHPPRATAAHIVSQSDPQEQDDGELETQLRGYEAVTRLFRRLP